MLKSIQNQMVFLKQCRQRHETTGSIIASSRFLAKAITRFLADRSDEPICVLECGPGTGAFTNRIVRILKPGDVFDLVEVNQSFVEVLQQRFVSEEAWRAVRELSNIHETPLQDFESVESYDFIISGLPLNNFPPDLVSTIMDTYFRLLKPTGTLSYFEYMLIRPIRKSVSRGAGGRRIREVDAVLQPHLQQCRVARDNVFLNTPPAWVQHLKLNPETAD